jgi:hypothetical protein
MAHDYSRFISLQVKRANVNDLTNWSAIPQHIVLGRFFVGLVVCISQVMVILWFRNCSGTFAGVILGCFTSLGHNDSIFVLFLLANWRTISDFQ